MEELKKDSNHLTRLEANRGAGAVFASPPGVVSSGAEAQLLFSGDSSLSSKPVCGDFFREARKDYLVLI